MNCRTEDDDKHLKYFRLFKDLVSLIEFANNRGK